MVVARRLVLHTGRTRGVEFLQVSKRKAQLHEQVRSIGVRIKGRGSWARICGRRFESRSWSCLDQNSCWVALIAYQVWIAYWGSRINIQARKRCWRQRLDMLRGRRLWWWTFGSSTRTLSTKFFCRGWFVRASTREGCVMVHGVFICKTVTGFSPGHNQRWV